MEPSEEPRPAGRSREPRDRTSGEAPVRPAPARTGRAPYGSDRSVSSPKRPRMVRRQRSGVLATIKDIIDFIRKGSA